MSNANEPDQVNSGALGVILVLVSFAVLGIALFVTSLVRQEVDETSGVRGQGQDRKARDLKNGQLAQLAQSPSFADRAKGLIQIPIDRAMALTLEAVRENPYALSPGVKPDGVGGAGPDEGGATDQGDAKEQGSTDASKEMVGDKPIGDKPIGDKPIGDKPIGDKPIGDSKEEKTGPTEKKATPLEKKPSAHGVIHVPAPSPGPAPVAPPTP